VGDSLGLVQSLRAMQEPRRVFVGTFLATTLIFLSIGAVVPVLPRYVSGPLGYGDIAVGIVIGAFAVTSVVLRPIGGRLSDRVGRRRVFVVGASVMAVAGLLYLVPFGLAGIVVARLVLGVGEGWVYTAAAAWVIDMTPEARRGRVIGLFGMSIWLGLSLGPAIGEALRGTGGYTAVWMFAAAAPAIAALCALRIPERRSATSDARDGTLLPRGVLLPGVALWCSVLGFAAMQGFVILMFDSRGIAHGAAVFTSFAVAVTVTRLCLSWVPDRIGAGRAAAVAAVGYASGLALLAVAQTWPVGLLGSLIMGAGYSSLFPALALIAVERTEERRRGAALGFFTSFFDLGMGIGAPLAGAAATAFGYGGMFGLAALLSLAGAVVALRGPRRTPVAGLAT
jgi:MFS family permease